MLLDLKIKKYTLYSFFILTLVFILIPYALLDTYELGQSLKIVFEYKIVFAVLSLFFCLYTDKVMFKPIKTKNFNRLIQIFKFTFGTGLIFLFFCGLVSGLLLSINAFFGKHELVDIYATVLSSHESTSRGGKKHYYITIEIPNEARKVEIKVKRRYLAGGIYQGQLYKGSLNMYYYK
jgi:hypothetical protein